MPVSLTWEHADRLLRHWASVGGLARYDDWPELAESPENYPEILARIDRFMEHGGLSGTEHAFMLRSFASGIRGRMAAPAPEPEVVATAPAPIDPERTPPFAVDPFATPLPLVTERVNRRTGIDRGNKPKE